MSDLFTSSPAGWALLFALGLRHGLDPDHIAVIDGLALGPAERGRGSAAWTGLLFSAGHGLSFTAATVTAALLRERLAPPPAVAEVVDWLSIAVLVGLGAANLSALHRPGDYKPAGWRARWLRGPTRGGPVAALAMGAVFGLMFDTVVQAAALGLAAAARGGVGFALLASLVFNLGMSTTDGVDGFLLARALRRGAERVRGYRRRVGWIVVALAFSMAALELISKLGGLEVNGVTLTVLGTSAAALALGASLKPERRRRPA